MLRGGCAGAQQAAGAAIHTNRTPLTVAFPSPDSRSVPDLVNDVGHILYFEFGLDRPVHFPPTLRIGFCDSPSSV